MQQQNATDSFTKKQMEQTTISVAKVKNTKTKFSWEKWKLKNTKATGNDEITKYEHIKNGGGGWTNPYNNSTIERNTDKARSIHRVDGSRCYSNF